MSKIIIHIEDGIDHERALSYVSRVIADGKVSEARGFKQYCFATTFTNHLTSKQIRVYACEKRHEDTDTFKVFKVKPIKIEHFLSSYRSKITPDL